MSDFEDIDFDEAVDIEDGSEAAPEPDEVGFKEYLNKNYDMSRDTLYQLIFGDDSAFYLDYVKGRKSSDISVEKWKTEDGKEKRIVSYRYHIKKKEKKASHVTELQTRDPRKDSSNCNIVENEVRNKGVLYADNFHILERWTITDVNNSKCNISVHAEIKFHKVNKVIKSIIKKKIRSGFKDAYAVLDSLLLEQMKQ
ncbi:protein Aster-B-like [Antedon mediterranea]|uniref:protein Aster-B-like n=1 Tax=Antedon mediterranea TaxID=105859 RepID=UPI003AF48D2A